jgi:hypothetical protein
VAPTAVPLSPEWWVTRLHKRLVHQQEYARRFNAYYCGEHPLPWLSAQAQDEFRRILKMTRSNYMGLVVDATAERLAIEGFRVGDSEDADDETWRIWQANDLDTYSDQGILEGLIVGKCYMLVAPNPADAATPLAWFEDPTQAIVEHAPGGSRRNRAAGLKLWKDDWTGRVNATLYLPGGLYKFETRQAPSTPIEALRWDRRSVPGEDWPAPNVLGVVPLVELPNNPRLMVGGRSELYDVTDIQDRINKTLADRLMTQDYGAFPQKWAAGWPEEDEAGNPQPKINVGRDRMVTTDAPRTMVEFGQWDASPLDPYSSAKREDVKDIASRTRTPAQYLLGEMSNVNGETLKASESGLVSKVRQRQRTTGDGVEDAVRLMRQAAGLTSQRETIETIWRDPQFRTEGERTDAVIKRLQSGLASLRQAREDYGYSATQIARLEQDDERERADPTLERVARDLTASTGGSGAPAGNA